MLWIDSIDLERFALRNDSQLKLPRLVADLILATSELPDYMRFLSDEAGEVRGFDGVLHAAKAGPFVPEGRSYWEFGVSPDIHRKAWESVTTRTPMLDVAEREQTTLVCVTPWHWDNPRKTKQELETELAAGRGWKAVVLLDGGALKDWLRMAPAVAAWWARMEMKSFPSGVLSVDEFWERFSTRFHPPLTAAVLLAGRADQATELLQSLATLAPDRILVAAESPEEAAAFAAAALLTAPPETGLILRNRTIVVDDPTTALALANRKLVFLPTGRAARLTGILAKAGPTILPLGRRDRAAGVIQLRRPPTHEFATALEDMGLTHARARQLATDSGCSVVILGRLIPGERREEPVWAEKGAALVPALLAGAWDAANEHDRAILLQLARATDYDAWQVSVQTFVGMDDAPLEFEGTVWKVRSSVDVLEAVGASIDGASLDAFHEACRKVLSDIDRNLGKVGYEAMAAGDGLRHSDWLREGLANTLALFGTRPDGARTQPAFALRGGREAWVNGIVAGLPGLSRGTELLASLGNVLPSLAEAAPIPFVQAIEKLIEDSPDRIRDLMRERVDFISPRSDHVQLLWALETVAWDEELFGRVASVLAALDTLDPGGRLLNRPLRSLRELFLAWNPQTNAPTARRLAILRALAKARPTVAWKLALGLLPVTHATSDLTHRPRYREAGAIEKHLTHVDVALTYRAASRLAVEMAEADPDRWPALAERMADLSPEDRVAAIQALDREREAGQLPRAREVLEAFDRLLDRHTEFPSANWALSQADLAPIRALVEGWHSNDPVEAAARVVNAAARAQTRRGADQQATQRLRDALKAVLRTSGPEALKDVAALTRHGWSLANGTAALLTLDQSFELSANTVGSSEAKLREFGEALARVAGAGDPAGWRSLVVTHEGIGATPAAQAALLGGLPDGPDTWALAETLGSETANAFWQTRPPFQIADAELLDTAVDRYLSAGNPWAALTTAHGSADVRPHQVSRVLAAVLKGLNSDQGDDGGMVQWRIQTLLEKARADPAFPRADLIRWEYAFLPFLVAPGNGLGDLALFEYMASDPALFVELVKTVYRGKSETPKEGGKGIEGRVRAASNALDAFHRTPGWDGTTLDSDALRSWVLTAARLTLEADRASVGLHSIGKLLAHAPRDVGDGAWPATAVRDLLEELASDTLEHAIRVERFNMRGVFSRGLYEGGRQERALVEENRDWMKACLDWPRTTAMLDAIAIEWEHHAGRADLDARQRLLKN